VILQAKDTFWATPAKWATLITSENIPSGKQYVERPVKNFDGVAVIDISGVLLREEDEVCEYFGGASTLRISRQLTAAVNDPAVSSILLYVNSPGGQVNGTAELADQIFAARKTKPVMAYVSGDCFSAGYWLASQAEKIFMHEAAGAGCLGVCYPVSGEYSDWIISDSTPNKHPEVATAESRAQMQVFLNDLAAIFMANIARGRGTNEQDVTANYGRGDIFIAAQAVAKGMADVVGSFETALSYTKNAAIANAAAASVTDETADANQDTTAETAQTDATPATDTSETNAIKQPLTAPTAGREIIGKKLNGEKMANKISAEQVDTMDITVDWLKANMPDLVQQIIDEGATVEQERQVELDAMAPANEEEMAAVAAARKDRKITAARLSYDLRIAAQAKAAAVAKAAAAARAHDDAEVVLPVTAPTASKTDEHSNKVLAAMKKRRAQ
jgi:ClpP class serine protease